MNKYYLRSHVNKKTNCFQQKCADLFDSKPVSQVTGVRQGRGQPHHTDGLLCVGGDEVCTGNNHLQHGSSVIPFITYKQL